MAAPGPTVTPDPLIQLQQLSDRLQQLEAQRQKDTDVITNLSQQLIQERAQSTAAQASRDNALMEAIKGSRKQNILDSKAFNQLLRSRGARNAKSSSGIYLQRSLSVQPGAAELDHQRCLG